MNWEFSVGWFIFGLIVLIAGGAITVLYRQISDNMASGVNSYERVKLVGIITCIVGLFIMANLHTAILSLITSLVFNRS